jgi:heme/copper-type cytochrome/quinol oxidase subunit 3
MSSVTRSMRATDPAAVRGVVLRRRSLPNGLWGMALLIGTEATLLSAIIASYWYLRFQATTWPPPGIPDPKVALPLVLTGVLVLTSVPVQLAAAAGNAARVGLTRTLLVLALLVQAGYLAVQIVQFVHDLHDFGPHTGAYASAYYAMLGAHHAHVAIGLLLDVGLLIRLAGGLTSYRLTGVRAIALYWHFVNLMAIIVVLTEVAPSL